MNISIYSERSRNDFPLVDGGVKTVVVKAGKCGAVFASFDGLPQRVPTTSVANVADTIFAGDLFNAGFFSGYPQGKDLVTCSAGKATDRRTYLSFGGGGWGDSPVVGIALKSSLWRTQC
ncbi:PfkB family carbohydrate kinase [Pasteurellaceae bacterium LIM206]|nr:PfkB family carbohydrate kinase [Pasteurellaceae bacterium LIM206]